MYKMFIQSLFLFVNRIIDFRLVVNFTNTLRIAFPLIFFQSCLWYVGEIDALMSVVSIYFSFCFAHYFDIIFSKPTTVCVDNITTVITLTWCHSSICLCRTLRRKFLIVCMVSVLHSPRTNSCRGEKRTTILCH